MSSLLCFNLRARVVTPFNFGNYDTEFISLYADGQSFPAKPFQPLFQIGHYTREYYQLIQTTGRHLKDRSLAISRSDLAPVIDYSVSTWNLMKGVQEMYR